MKYGSVIRSQKLPSIIEMKVHLLLANKDFDL